jgi:hypothetical protein
VGSGIRDLGVIFELDNMVLGCEIHGARGSDLGCTIEGEGSRVYG